MAKDWTALTSIDQLEEIRQRSYGQPMVLFKHSTSCSISRMALDRVQRHWTSNFPTAFYYLDLLAYRPVSNAVAEVFAIQHESPQLLVIAGGRSVFDSSHYAIRPEEVDRVLARYLLKNQT